MTEEQPKKKVEVSDGQNRVERNKITDTAAQNDQTEKFRNLRRELAKGERAFSVASLIGPTSGAKFEVTDGSKRVAAATSPAAKMATAEALKDAEAIRKATGNDNIVARWADRDAINKILEGKTQAERTAIDEIYKQKYGRGLEKEMRSFETGSDLEKFLNVLKRSDTNSENQAALTLHQDLLENKDFLKNRSSKQIEKDMRDLLGTRNATQINKIAEEYKKTYGTNLQDALTSDARISAATRDSLPILFKGVENRTDQDTAKLIASSLQYKDSELFAESMRDASPQARKAFLESGGEGKVKSAFSHWYSDKDVQHAMDYARTGKLTAATQITDNTGVLFDNKKGIELAIDRMTDQERRMYSEGNDLYAGKPVANLSREDADKARGYYDNLHQAIAATANPTELIKYENQIASRDQNSLISTLAMGRGTLWNASTNDILSDVKNMTPAQYEQCKQHPENREDLKRMLSSLNKSTDDSARALNIYDNMMAAPDYEHARDAVKPNITTDIQNDKHWYGSNANEILNAIGNMSASDRSNFKNDAQFRAKLEKQVEETIQNPRQLDAAKRMLQQIKEGRAPDNDPISKLETVNNADGSKTSLVVRDIEKSFRNDPSLQSRVLNPQSDLDKKFATEYKAAVQQTLGGDFDLFGKPLIETGRLPLELKMGMNQGVFSNDYKTAFEDLQQATLEEKQKLKMDPAYRAAVLGFMDKNRQQIALATIDQKELRPEDNLRVGIAGWLGSADVVNQLQQIKPEQLTQVKEQYAEKYGSSLEGDLMKKLSGQDRDVVERVLTQNLNQSERIEIAQTQTERARSGFSASVSDNVFRSGTGAQADDAQNQTAKAEAEKNATEAAISSGQALAQNMSTEQLQALQNRVNEHLEQSINFQNKATANHIESKKKGAEIVGNSVVIGGAIGSLIVTGGMDAPLILGLAAAGAGVKVGANAALEGNNYDLSIKNVGFDAASGSVTAASSVFGPGEVAAIFGIGKAAAIEAAKITAAETGKQLLVEGGKETLTRGTQEIVRNSLARGAVKMNRTDFTNLAEKTIAPALKGDAREQAVKELSVSLERNVSDQMAQGVVTRFGAHGLNATSGATAGGASGAMDGVKNWDSRQSVAQNLETIATHTGENALTGLVTGGATSLGTSAIARSFRPAQTGLRDGAADITQEAHQAPEIANIGKKLDSQNKPIEVEWPRVQVQDLGAVRAQVKVDLAQVKASGGGSVLEKLETAGMSEEQKTCVLDALGEVREHYAKNFATDPDQPVNWIHTQGELGRVVDAARASHATPAQTEDAILASMFSDSLKTKANFTTHHLDGELAAEHVLSTRLNGDFTQERLDGILHAIKEHQIAPPKFMAMIYGGMIRKATGRPLTAEEESALSSLQAKMSDPFHQPTNIDSNLAKTIKLSDDERALLSKTGVTEWHVPSENSPWYKISRILADADGIDNYATAGGLSKIVQIRGPETGLFFKDGNLRYENPSRTAGTPVNSSQESWRDSFKDFATIASPANLLVAESAAKDAEQSAIKAQGRVDAWLHERLGVPADHELPTIPGWTGSPEVDGEGHAIINANGTLAMRPDNLKYPDYEPGWWAIHNKPVGSRTPAEQHFYEDPANRYRGLNSKEIEDFKLAREIRDRYAAELRKEQRVAGDNAPVYQPAAAH